MSKSPINKRGHPSAALWLVDASYFSNHDLAFFAGQLGPSEANRYRRFARTARQRQFLVGRMLLRVAVGEAMALAPSEIAIVEQPAGAPQLVLPQNCGTQPGFSLSHSGKWAACAVSRDTLLGLDIEIINPNRDLLAIGQSVFGAKETALLAALHGEERVAAFYHLWSLREALFKLFSGSGNTDRWPELLDAGNAMASCGKGWHSQVFAHPGFSCVLCSTVPLSPPAFLKPDEISCAGLMAAIRTGRMTRKTPE